jgi:mannosyltransferase OCH1-like enzyme
MTLTTKRQNRSNQNDEARCIDSELLEKHCLYYAAILGASLWASWITWMPFLHVSVPAVRHCSTIVCYHTKRCDCQQVGKSVAAGVTM